jgi:hypothetical protein
LVRARQLVDEATDGLEKQAAAAPTNLSIKDWLGTAWRLRAELLDAAGEPGAAAAAARSVELAEGNVAAGPTNENHVAVLAQAHVTAGQIAAHARDHAAAQRHGKRALDLVEGRLAQSSHWRILDPAARALALLGDAERQRVIVDRLNRIGYQPLEPWLQIGSP